VREVQSGHVHAFNDHSL